MNCIQRAAAATVFLTASCAAQATTTYTDEAAFAGAAGGSLAFEGFETVASSGIRQYNFTDVSFACTGSAYCPGFFGVSGALASDGVQSVYFASPDSSTFTFSQGIKAFGIWIGDAGTAGAVTLTASLGNGDTVTALSNYSAPANNWQYFGIVSDAAFTSITFTPSNANDGIYFDSLRYRFAAADVSAAPEPASTLLLGIAGAALLVARRKRSERC